MSKKEKSIFPFSHYAMGTTFEIFLVESEEEYAGQVSQAVFTEIDRIEDLLTCFNPGSEIGQINRLHPGKSKRIGVETYECLRTAFWVQSQTKGAFDANIRSLANLKDGICSDYEPPRLDILKQVKLSRTSQGFSIKILPVEGITSTEIGHIRPSLDLDLGGIGKGYALDKILELLSDWGINRALIEAGTSTALAIGAPVHGPGMRKGWPLGIGGYWELSRAPKKYFLKDRALSGSGTEIKGDHIIDPRTGEPVRGHLAAWASHPSAAVADALSTAFMVMTTEEVRAFCECHPEVWALVIIDPQTCEVFNPDIAT